ncbi:MAG: hypothetical protein WC511_05660 [Candidatus Pacearchaeota archaeon]
MKNSTILIVAGIIIMIIGGIVLLNTIQAEENKENSAVEKSGNYNIMKRVEVVGNKLRPYEQPPQNPLVAPITIIIFGMVVFAAGAYDAHRSLGG